MGIPFRNDHLYTLIFAGDQVDITHDAEELALMLRKLEQQNPNKGLAINLSKIEYLTRTRQPVKNLKIEKVDKSETLTNLNEITTVWLKQDYALEGQTEYYGAGK